MESLSKLSPIKRQMFHVLLDGIKRLFRDDCSDDDVYNMLNRYNAESRGYFNEHSFVNYDEAMKILHIGNRVTLKAFLDRHNVKMRKINNQRVGFLRSEVEALENIAREAK